MPLRRSSAISRWKLQARAGALSARKCSSIDVAQWGPASSPDSGQIRRVTRPPGREKRASPRPRMAAVITSAHSGPAPLMPETFSMLAPSKLPTQTPTVTSGV